MDETTYIDIGDGVQVIQLPAAVGEFDALFRRVDCPLFHYTDEIAARSMSEKGTFWLTRADCFLDESEINYGIGLLVDAIQLEGESPSADTEGQLLDVLHDALRETFIFSLTDQPESAFMRRNYGKWQVRFENFFPTHFWHLSWQRGPSSMNNSMGQHIPEVFEHFDRFVIYDRHTQLLVARRAVRLLRQYLAGPSEDAMLRLTEWLAVRDALIKAVIMTKDESFAPEREFRICLLRNPNPGHEERLDKSRTGGGKLCGKTIHFAELSYPVKAAHAGVSLLSHVPLINRVARSFARFLAGACRLKPGA